MLQLKSNFLWLKNMIKKVVIAAAGRGTRMKQITNNIPKPLIKVLGKPFLYYLLENFKKAGYKEFFIVTGHKSEKIEEFIQSYDPKIKTINQFKTLGLKEYGTACPIKCVEPYIGNENFVAVYGDNLYSPRDMKSFNIDDNYIYAGGLKHFHPEKYGILITQNGFVKEIIEKPTKPTTNLINCGFYKFTPEIFKAVKKVKKSKRGEYELTDAVSLLAKKGKVKVKMIKDFWLDFGNLSDISKVTRFLKKYKVGDKI